MERAMRECAFSEDEIKEAIGALTVEFKKSEAAGQVKWAKVRKAILRRRSEAEGFARAEQAEAEMVKSYTERRKRTAPHVFERMNEIYRQTLST
jgi:hypothetical protein